MGEGVGGEVVVCGGNGGRHVVMSHLVIDMGAAAVGVHRIYSKP
jgi:hypothetical protein